MYSAPKVYAQRTMTDRQTVLIWDTNPHTPRLYFKPAPPLHLPRHNDLQGLQTPTADIHIPCLTDRASFTGLARFSPLYLPSPPLTSCSQPAVSEHFPAVVARGRITTQHRHPCSAIVAFVAAPLSTPPDNDAVKTALFTVSSLHIRFSWFACVYFAFRARLFRGFSTGSSWRDVRGGLNRAKE